MSKDKKSSYYDAGGIETIKIIKAKLTSEQYKGFLLGNIIKYSCRSNFKGCQERDIEKVNIYSGFLDEVLKNEKQPENDVVYAQFDDEVK